MYRIKKELNNIYLVMDNEEGTSEDYKLGMLTENTIPGFIPVQIRDINGKQSIYYDITGKVNLVKAVSTKNMGYEDIFDLFSCLCKISETAYEYLFDESLLIYEPDLIFKDIKTGKYEMLCNPQREENSEGMTELLDALITNIDNEDEYAVKAVYSLYEIVSNENAGIRDYFEKVVEIGKDRPMEEYEIPPIDMEIPVNMEEIEEPTIKPKGYKPSLKEIACLGLAIQGIILIGISAYFGYFVV